MTSSINWLSVCILLNPASESNWHSVHLLCTIDYEKLINYSFLMKWFGIGTLTIVFTRCSLIANYWGGCIILTPWPEKNKIYYYNNASKFWLAVHNNPFYNHKMYLNMTVFPIVAHRAHPIICINIKSMSKCWNKFVLSYLLWSARIRCFLFLFARRNAAQITRIINGNMIAAMIPHTLPIACNEYSSSPV